MTVYLEETEGWDQEVQFWECEMGIGFCELVPGAVVQEVGGRIGQDGGILKVLTVMLLGGGGREVKHSPSVVVEIEVHGERAGVGCSRHSVEVVEVVCLAFANVHWGAEVEGIGSWRFEGFVSDTGVVELDCIGSCFDVFGVWLVFSWFMKCEGKKGDSRELFPAPAILSKETMASNPSQPCSNCLVHVTIGRANCLHQETSVISGYPE